MKVVLLRLNLDVELEHMELVDELDEFDEELDETAGDLGETRLSKLASSGD